MKAGTPPYALCGARITSCGVRITSVLKRESGTFQAVAVVLAAFIDLNWYWTAYCALQLCMGTAESFPSALGTRERTRTDRFHAAVETFRTRGMNSRAGLKMERVTATMKLAEGRSGGTEPGRAAAKVNVVSGIAAPHTAAIPGLSQSLTVPICPRTE